MSRPSRRQRTPFLTIMLIAGLVLGTPIALLILFTYWNDSPQRQIAGLLGIVGLGAFLLVRYKYEVLILALIFLSQFEISLYSIPLAKPAILQFFLSDVFLLLFLVAAFERGEKLRFDSLAKVFVALIAWQTISALFFSAHMDRSLIFMFWQIKYLIIYVLLQNYALTDDMARKIKIAILLVIGIQATLAFAQQLAGGTLGLVVFGEQDPTRLFFAKGALRVSGTLGATNGFAGYMAMLLVAVLPFMFREKNLLWYAVYGAGTIALLMTFSRAGWLGFACGAALVALALVRVGAIRFTRIVALGALGVLLIGIGVASYYEGVQERFEDRRAIASAEGRLTQFYEMWPVIQKHSIAGIGPGVTEYFGAWNDNAHYVREKFPDIWLSNQPHSSQLQTWIEGGTPAFALFMIMFVMIFKSAMERPDSSTESRQVLYLRIGAVMAAAAVMIAASFGTGINSYQTSMSFWILMGLARNRSRTYLRHGPTPTIDKLELDWQQISRSGGQSWFPRQ